MIENWISDKLKNCFKLKSGDGLTSKSMIPGPYPVYGGNGIAGYHSDFNLSDESVIVGRVGALCGNARFINERIWLTDNAFKIIECKYEFDPVFLQYLLNYHDLRSYARQTAQPVISNSSLKDIILTFPKSLPEQKRIVEILDEAFEAIDQAKANIEQNIQNAEELFQSKLNAIFSQKGEGWEEKRLKDITSKIGSGATPRGGKDSYKDSGISLIRSMNVYDDGFVENKLAFIDNEQADKLSNVTIEEGDVLLNITGASVARCCVVPTEFLPARVNQHVSIIRLVEGIFYPSFLHYSLISRINKDRLLGIGEQGATRQAITKAQIEDFMVSYPKTKAEQKAIINELDIYKSNSELLVQAYQAKIYGLEELKKSILQKAFGGELTGKVGE
ncbi:MAG: restriction endonuclease subunit S [Balneolaceae bacterium]|nr:restriction endonuclease subunit S [Balneolaceae bacterium]MBO6546594.1 restriction endonuclease subunit S [Balneolaceae bacterium]MBO6648953.1 restriction endonuclease subunit S [Balneolaceae bacterium]